MILYDFSSALHRSIFTSSNMPGIHKKDGKLITEEFIANTIGRVVREILEFSSQNKKEYGDFLICCDDHSKQYWRKEIYPPYKGQRAKNKEESEIDWNGCYKHLNLLREILDNYSQFRVINVPGAEADDIICVLTRKYCQHEKVLIHSPDKDFKQLHKFGNIKQWSALTNKWVIDDEQDMEFFHPILGDAGDNVPRIVDFSKFTDVFRDYLINNYNEYSDELKFYNLDWVTKDKIIQESKVEPYEKIRFGKSTVEKNIKKFGSLDNFLDSNPIYRLNYELNKKLVLDSEIPVKIEADILKQFLDSKKDLNFEKIRGYLNYYKLKDLIIDYENSVRSDLRSIPLTVDNCGF